MSTTPFLGITLLTVGQSTPETTVNDALQRLENAMQRKLAPAMTGASSTYALSNAEFTTYGYFAPTGTGAVGTLVVPISIDGNGTLINRIFWVNNTLGAALTVSCTGGGTSISLATGEICAAFCDGVNVLKLSSTNVTQVFTANANVITNTSGSLTTETPIYDITPFFGGKPTISGGLMGRMVIGRNLSLGSGAVGWQAYAGTPAADASQDITIKKNGSSIGTITFASGSNTGSFTFATTVSLSGGDRLEFYAPAVQDSALSDISICIKATRTLP